MCHVVAGISQLWQPINSLVSCSTHRRQIHALISFNWKPWGNHGFSISNERRRSSFFAQEQKFFFPLEPINWGEPISEPDGEIPTSPYSSATISSWNVVEPCSIASTASRPSKFINLFCLKKHAWFNHYLWSAEFGYIIISTYQNYFGWLRNPTPVGNYWSTYVNTVYSMGSYDVYYDVCPTNWWFPNHPQYYPTPCSTQACMRISLCPQEPGIHESSPGRLSRPWSYHVIPLILIGSMRLVPSWIPIFDGISMYFRGKKNMRTFPPKKCFWVYVYIMDIW